MDSETSGLRNGTRQKQDENESNDDHHNGLDLVGYGCGVFHDDGPSAVT